MKTELNRRAFSWQTTAGIGGLMTFPWLDELDAVEPDRNPGEKRLLLLGLNALARAHSMSYFTDGHRGASLVSAQLLCEENHLSDGATARIEQLFDLNWAKSPLCQPFPEEEPDPEAVKKIGEALGEGKGVLREVGHNAIFATLAIKGFRILPEAATPSRIEGVCKLIRAIKPWRDEADPDPEVDPPPFADEAAASTFVLREASTAVDRWKGFGQGFSGHMLTFGQALVELAAMGDLEWAESCRLAFRKYVTITRKGPQADDKPIADRSPSPLKPNSEEYWKKRGDKQLGIGHVFKYPYSYYDLLRRIDDPALREEWKGKEYLVF